MVVYCFIIGIFLTFEYPLKGAKHQNICLVFGRGCDTVTFLFCGIQRHITTVNSQAFQPWHRPGRDPRPQLKNHSRRSQIPQGGLTVTLVRSGSPLLVVFHWLKPVFNHFPYLHVIFTSVKKNFLGGADTRGPRGQNQAGPGEGGPHR